MKHRLPTLFAARVRALCAVALACASGAAQAGPLAMEVRGEVDRDSGAVTYATPDAFGHRIDFGYVTQGADLGLRNGQRVALPGGETQLVATFMLSVVQEEDGFSVRRLGSRALDRGLPVALDPGLAPARGPSTGVTKARGAPARGGRAGPGGRGGIYIPAAGDSNVQVVDLYARVDDLGGQRGSVWFAPGDDADWAADGAAVELGFTEILVASGVSVGESYLCQLALRFPADAIGAQGAEVRFTARPALGGAGFPGADLPGRSLPGAPLNPRGRRR
jgi:hypothetical protein